MRHPEKVERRPGRIPDVRHPDKVERWPGKIPDVRHPGGMAAEKNSGYETSEWNELCHASQGAVCVCREERAT